MATVYRITITKKSKETFTGLMTRSQPEIINGFVALADEEGKWRYFSPDSIEDFLFDPVEPPAEQTTE
ncbi:MULTISPECIES: hypothetical protein [Enterobacter cloacae complex]|uniref:Uncharacterized protein n=2 Tax=Enterobacter kobei TaxID=208224 RepID=A0AA86ISG3_9ENTR|nr:MULTISPECIES: hypothetical protein [Enterobacter cloacae complex]OLR21465.1 hypothetical protein BH713_12810 [Enterobacter kobei]QFI34264.1 hypothetical protein F1597_20180 [Enterobacter hormaechei]BCU55151.1 hypothetical protein ENKO_17450 [Enterobacter kobei]SIQ95017.1 hypothetical protein SAMN05444841_102568 [Enterobacter kobei]